jgi:hypothetical protein
MQSKLKQIQELAHKCLAEDSNNPSWNATLLACLAKIEYFAEQAAEAAGPDEDPLFLTRQTVRQFKAVKQ